MKSTKTDDSFKNGLYSTLTKQKAFKNIFILSFCWSTTSFNYYLSDFFLQHYNGNIYQNAVALRSSEIAGYLLAIPLMQKLGQKNSFTFSYWMSSLALILYLTPFNYKKDQFYAFCILLANFGVTLTFTPLYLLTQTLFKTKIAATVFSLCNLIARFLTIFAPLFAETGQNLGLELFLCSTVMSGLLIR